jgi:hypothetical protein
MGGSQGNYRATSRDFKNRKGQEASRKPVRKHSGQRPDLGFRVEQIEEELDLDHLERLILNVLVKMVNRE